ncbi:MAG: 6-carboxytetrahydropterin synthase [Gemmatimonadetes bacterium]|nr:6-carboxytetrahydropterin synthase [Gemmatimonadota bacterium]
MTIRSFALLGLCVLAPAMAQGQVGYTPRKSPYRDLARRQELTFFGGMYQASKDPAGVAPQSGPTAGAHYEFHISGPAYFTARTAVVLSERQVIDPTKLLTERFLGKESMTMVLSDIGFALNLTGYKSWHGIVPTLGGGLGIGAGFDSPDVGGYKFGYPFLLAFRPAISSSPADAGRGASMRRTISIASATPIRTSRSRPPTPRSSRRRTAGTSGSATSASPPASRTPSGVRVARAYLTRRVTFAAAHRYRRPEWDDARNEAVFGLCARPNYHGHTYTCDVTVGARSTSRQASSSTSANSIACWRARCASATTIATSTSTSPSLPREADPERGKRRPPHLRPAPRGVRPPVDIVEVRVAEDVTLSSAYRGEGTSAAGTPPNA